MRLKTAYTNLLLFLLSLSLHAQQTPRCELQILETPEDLARQAEIELHTQNWIQNNSSQASAREVITIPVVVHVVYFDDIENIPDQQIFEQLEVLNEDFRFLNEDTDGIPSLFRGAAADVEMEFCLVSIDPGGEATTGITRTQTMYECIGNTVDELDGNGKPRLFYSDEGGVDVWDTEQYLNLYVANTCERFLGRAKLPGTASPNEDAPVIDYDHFGGNCTPSARPFHLGRTATHELGHFFNLRHIYGSNSGCNDDDFVADTPLQGAAYRGCPPHPQLSCSSFDQFMNFMDLVDDICMKMFTNGQKDRMLASLAPGGPRSGLAMHSLCAPPTVSTEDVLTVFPNPVRACLHFDFQTKHTGPVDVRLYNALGQLVYKRRSNSFALKPIDTANLSAGIYWLVVAYEDEVVSRKVVK